MNTVPQASADLTRLSELIENLPVAMLTNLDAAGEFVSRPMTPLEMDGQGALWFFTDLRAQKVEHLRVANLSFADTANGTYVSLSGRGDIDTDLGRIERLWTPHAKPWFPEGPDSPHLALLKFIPSTAEYWDAPDSKMVRMFAMAVSAVAGKPIDLGDHETLTGLTADDAPPPHMIPG